MNATPRELFLGRLAGGSCEGRIPFCPRDLTLGLDAMGVRTDSVFGGEYDSRLSAACVLALQAEVGHDVTMGCISSYGLEVFGGEMKYPPDGIPYASGYPFDDIDRMDRYQPEQIVGDLVRGMRRSCEIVREKRPDLGLCINIPGPVTMAGFARRLETVMMDLLENPDIVEKLVSFCTDALIVQSEYMTDGIADALYMASASDNPDMMGDDDYRRHSLPAVSRISERMRSLGIPSVFHPHGVFSTDDRRGLFLESASVADGFQFAEGNEPGPIAEACGDSCAVLGGINGFSSLLLGPEERIRRDVGRFIDAMEGRRYIMTCSCSVNRGLPIGNLKVVADELRRRTA